MAFSRHPMLILMLIVLMTSMSLADTEMFFSSLQHVHITYLL